MGNILSQDWHGENKVNIVKLIIYHCQIKFKLSKLLVIIVK